jgi:hypothetical protein
MLELSIVLIIIGVLAAGIMQGKSLVKRSKLKTAESLTSSAPVTLVDGLMLWFETTSQDSFSPTPKDEDYITSTTSWNNLNPQFSDNYYALTSSSTGIQYIKYSNINSLPALYFNGSTDAYLTLSSTKSSLTPTGIITPGNAFTFFIVSKKQQLGTANNVFYNGDKNNNGWGYQLGSSNERTLTTSSTDFSDDIHDLTTKTEIISVSYTGGSTGTISMYLNGTKKTMTVATASGEITIPSAAFYIGTVFSSLTNNFEGLISEIIIYNRNLPDRERRYIERYLGKKFSINDL